MKKILACVLAVVLAFGMCTVAFAASDVTAIDVLSGTVYTYDDDDKAMYLADADDLDANTTYYIPVVDVTSGTAADITKLSDLTNNYKIRNSISDGSSYISSKPAFVIKSVSATYGDYHPVSASKTAFITFTTADKFNMEEVDLDMTIKVYPDESSYDISLNGVAQVVGTSTPAEIEEFTNSTICYRETEASSYFLVPSGAPIVTFDDIDDEIEMEFGDDDEEVVFIVNATNQKDLFLRLDTEDEALEDKYPNAELEIRYFAGNNKTFRKTGELTIPTDLDDGDEPYLYEVVDGKLTLCEDAKYDSSDEAFVIKTNKLGNYVISDTKLVDEDADDSDEDGDSTDSTDSSGDATTNPDTGANDFVGLAVALAVVSVAGIAVAKKR
ncbi:hypothetical protein H8711_04335 [Clostridiaceae bacterium NSJ-31]|uniref:PGF-CTERM sorting domain-containing protein n=1 Tax=Ligaoa zhengdingensis TaxID=2763658 RepID=A0A926DYC1_9FIRM|nr:hypothetical protein [Ligaoa zhengdingensis]MBC8546163.1 hypothetical protein [Ligaoa zhengdingensis]